MFRDRIAAIARASGIDPSIPDEVGEENPEGVPPLGVDEPFPWGAQNLMPPTVLRALPALPDELEYRFVGRDLVLIDIHANLVVDILDAAVTPLPGACDVHPDLPACVS
jgi:hypothetical protein